MASLRDRLVSAGVDPDRADQHLRDGWIRVDGTVVTDGDTDTDGRVVVWPPQHQPG